MPNSPFDPEFLTLKHGTGGGPVVKIAKRYELLQGMDDPTIPINLILDQAIRELCVKFPDYGNSYLAEGLDFWYKRLDNETDEYINAQTPAQRRRKLANILNIAWMAYRLELVWEGTIK